VPQDGDEGDQRHHGTQETQCQIQGRIDEHLQIVGDSLVRVVGAVVA
jgi:hypothetical protein